MRVFMTVMNEFCCDTSKIFCFNSLLSALTYFQIWVKHSSYCDEISSEREKKKKRSLAPKRLEVSYLAQNFLASRSFLLGSKFLRKATRVLLSLSEILSSLNL